MTEKELKQDSGKLKKLYATIKKAVAKEFLWMLLVLGISIPLALILQYIISKDAKILSAELAKDLNDLENILAPEQPAFWVLYTITVAGIYFTRLVAGAIKTQLNDKK